MRFRISIFELLLVFIFLFINRGINAQNGAFWDDQEPKSVTIPSFTEMEKPSPADPASIVIQVDAEDTVAKVSKYIYGTNANLYSGIGSSETKLIDYIKLLKPEIIRYPGGLHSDEYFWDLEWNWNLNKPDGSSGGWYVNLRDDLPDLLWSSSGEFVSSYWRWMPASGYWTFGLDDYYQFLENTGCEGLITVNYALARYGTGPNPVQAAAKYAADWVRYDNGRTKFWEIGNEDVTYWSVAYKIKPESNQDNQPEIITSKLYGEHVQVFIDSMRKAADDIGHTIFIGVQNDPGMFEGAGNTPDWVLDHTYFTPYQQNSSPSEILNSVETEAEKYITKTKEEAVTWGVDEKPLAMTEWNIFAEGSGQASSYINGMHAVLVLGELIKNKYGMANRWDIANGWDAEGDDMGMFSGGNSAPDAKWNPRAPYFYMYYFNKYFGDYMLNSTVSGSGDVVAYASGFSDSGQSGVVVLNRSTKAETVKIDMQNFGLGDRYYLYNLTGGDDNTFSFKTLVNGQGPPSSPFIGGPIDDLESIKSLSAPIGGQIKFSSPPLSVQYVLIEHGTNEIIPVQSLVISGADGKNTIDTNEGTLQLSVEITPSNASEQTVTWSVISGEEYGEISSSGLITAKKNGEMTLKATANDGSEVYDEFVVTISNQAITAVSIEEIKDLFKIYPNPTKNDLTIDNAMMIKCIRVIDLKGRELKRQYSGQNDNLIVDMESIPFGIYLLEINTINDQTIKKKIIKIE